MAEDPTNDYVFLAPDDRSDVPGAAGNEISWPYIRKDDTQDIDWWSGEPATPGKPIDFSADPNYPNDETTFRAMQAAAVGGFPLLRPSLVRALRPYAPASAQFIPSYVKTARGPYDWDEDWFYLNVWKMHDVIDRDRSEPTMLDGEPFGTWDSIRLDADAIGALPPQERGIIRLTADDDDLLIYQRDVANVMLDHGIAGALLVPLMFYAPAMRYLRDHRAEIDVLNGLAENP